MTPNFTLGMRASAGMDGPGQLFSGLTANGINISIFKIIFINRETFDLQTCVKIYFIFRLPDTDLNWTRSHPYFTLFHINRGDTL